MIIPIKYYEAPKKNPRELLKKLPGTLKNSMEYRLQQDWLDGTNNHINNIQSYPDNSRS